jgi:predicted DNA-binding transcriptional regulator AlpA
MGGAAAWAPPEAPVMASSVVLVLPPDLAELRAVSVKEAEALLNISHKLLYRLLAEGQLPSFLVSDNRLGSPRCRRIPLSAIREFMQRRMQGGAGLAAATPHVVADTVTSAGP